MHRRAVLLLRGAITVSPGQRSGGGTRYSVAFSRHLCASFAALVKPGARSPPSREGSRKRANADETRGFSASRECSRGTLLLELESLLLECLVKENLPVVEQTDGDRSSLIANVREVKRARLARRDSSWDIFEGGRLFFRFAELISFHAVSRAVACDGSTSILMPEKARKRVSAVLLIFLLPGFAGPRTIRRYSDGRCRSRWLLLTLDHHEIPGIKDPQRSRRLARCNRLTLSLPLSLFFSRSVSPREFER